MTDQTGTVVKKRRALIAVGVLLLALCAGGACLALKGGKTGGPRESHSPRPGGTR